MPETLISKKILKDAFRPFFLAAALYSLLSMTIWFAIFFLKEKMSLSAMLPISWHAHEMIYGYSMAVIAGYLIFVPRVRGGVKASYSMWMFAMLLLWLATRTLPFVPHESALLVMFVLDLLFGFGLFIITLMKLLEEKSWQGWGTALLVGMIVLSNAVYYLGLLGRVADGERIGLFAGVYLLLAILLLICETAVSIAHSSDTNGQSEKILPDWLLISSLMLLLVLGFTDVASPNSLPVIVLSMLLALLFILNAVYRIFQGNRYDLLNWAVAAAYLFIVIGFAMKASDSLNHLLPRLGIHAFMIGSVGIMTTAVMASSSPRASVITSSRFKFAVFLMFGAISGAAVIHVFAPLWLAPKYVLIIGASQLGWIVGVLLFLIIFTPSLLSRRRRSRIWIDHTH